MVQVSPALSFTNNSGPENFAYLSTMGRSVEFLKYIKSSQIVRLKTTSLSRRNTRKPWGEGLRPQQRMHARLMRFRSHKSGVTFFEDQLVYLVREGVLRLGDRNDSGLSWVPFLCTIFVFSIRRKAVQFFSVVTFFQPCSFEDEIHLSVSSTILYFSIFSSPNILPGTDSPRVPLFH